jgi:DNA invertase Pin-like site-specific DNA recombinase
MRTAAAVQGIAKAKENCVYKGRMPNGERNEAILAMLDKGASCNDVCKATGASRSSLSCPTKRHQGPAS